MKRMLKREEGQSLLIVAGALVLLVAFLALVVDAGNAYVQRRKVQNAMDAGSRAGALAWASDQNNAQVDGAIRNSFKE
jgi:Flp pilus assembly protein TadG